MNDDGGVLLRKVMASTGTTQSELSRMSGVHQPSISQFLSGKIEMSDEQLGRLLSCLGSRLEVVRRSVIPELTRSERRSWLLHRSISCHLTRSSLENWVPIVVRNLDRLRESVTGQPHQRNLERWSVLINERDVIGLKRVMTGLNRESIEMREVSPLSGVLPENERREILERAS